MENSKNNNYPYFAVVLAVLMMGMSPILFRFADAPGTVTSFYRLAVATLILTIPFYRNVKKVGLLPKTGVMIAIGAGVLFAIDIATFATAIVIGGATIPTLMSNTSPIWVGLGTLWFLKDKLPNGFWGGLAIALIGVLVVMGGDLKISGDASQGIWLGLLSAIFYGGYYLMVERGRVYLDALSMFWVAAFVSTLSLGIIVLFMGQSFVGYSSQTYLIFLIAGIGPQILGFLSLSYALGHLPASVVTPTLLGQPLVTGILAAPFLGEVLSVNQIYGGLVILVGILIIHRTKDNIKRNQLD
jgi:drug/metabolite transporter (DMT)-like permease